MLEALTILSLCFLIAIIAATLAAAKIDKTKHNAKITKSFRNKRREQETRK